MKVADPQPLQSLGSIHSLRWLLGKHAERAVLEQLQ